MPSLWIAIIQKQKHIILNIAKYNNKKEEIKFKVMRPNKKYRNTPQIKKQVSTTRPKLYRTHPELQHTEIKNKPLY
jgi:hypothetical protein